MLLWSAGTIDGTNSSEASLLDVHALDTLKDDEDRNQNQE